MKYKTVRQK